MHASQTMMVLTIGCLALAGCHSSTFLPRETNGNSTAFRTYEEVEAAYGAVDSGTTRAPDLAKLGFDAAVTPNVEILNNPDISERFLLQGGRDAGHVPQPVQSCIERQDRCTGYLFHLRHLESHHVGNALLDVTGFKKSIIDTGWSADVLLVLQDGVVVYKIISGRPHIEERREAVQPLGPLQNIGGASPDPEHRKGQ